MDPPKLTDIAAKAIGEAIWEEKAVLPYKASVFASNKIITSLCSNHETFPDIRDFHLLDVTMGDFQNVVICLDDIPMIAKFNLLTLKLNIPKHNFEAYKRDNVLNLPHLLTDCLNDHSRQSLKTLHITHRDELTADWFEKLMEITKSVTVLIMEKMSGSPFSRLTKSYPQLKHLDISRTNITTLHGISHLPNLEELIMSDVRFNSAADFQELFLLKKLLKLDLSCTTKLRDSECGIVKQILELHNALPLLTYIDLSNREIDIPQISKLFKLLPSLEKICLYQTSCSSIVHERIEVMHADNLRSAFQLLKHFREIKRRLRIKFIVEDIYWLVKSDIVLEEMSEFTRELWTYLLGIVESYSEKKYEIGWSCDYAIKSVLILSRNYLKHLTNFEKTCLVFVLLSNKHVGYLGWTILGVDGILNIPNLDLVVVYQKVIDYFVNYEQHNFNRGDVALMMNVLQDLDKRLPVEKKTRIQRIKEAVFGMLRFLRYLYARSSSEEDQTKLRQHLVQIQDTLKLLLSGRKFAFDIVFITDVIDYMRGCQRNVFFKYVLATFVEKLLLHVSYSKIRYLVTVEKLFSLMECMVGIVEEIDNNSEIRDETRLAFVSMKIMATLMHTRESSCIVFDITSFERHLILYANRINYTDFIVPVIRIGDSTETYHAYGVGNIKDWAALTMEAVCVLSKDTFKRNEAFFAAKITPENLSQDRNIQGDILEYPST